MSEWWLSALKAQGQEKVTRFQCAQEGTEVCGTYSTCTNMHTTTFPTSYVCNLCPDVLPEPRVCDGVISGYNVRYRLNTGNGEHTTVNTSTTSVMLQDLAPNAEYSVEVAVTTSVGTIGPYSSESLLTVTGK